MSLHTIDIAIIGAYLILVVLAGVYIRKRASQDIESYFLCGCRIPWYYLGMSNASSMFDITGTMWLVTILFIYGLKGAWLPWLWPTFNQIFLMIYLARWIRRSNVITGAEWIGTRFGEGRGAELSRLSVVIFALVMVIGYLTYAFQGIGRFASVFFPFDWAPSTYAIILMTITTIYVILGGMYSVVITDVIQFVILTVTSFILGIIAFNMVNPGQLAAVVPDGWKQLFFGWELNLDWSSLIPAVNGRIETDGYNFFTIIMMMIIIKGILNSMAGTAPNYDMQRVLATRNPKESSLMSGLVSIALFPRWLMIAAITVLGLVFFSDHLQSMGDFIDFELIMPYVVNSFIPVGVTGLIIAGLLAAYMSTFDSTVNAGAAYLVNDIYKRYIRKNGTTRQYMLMSYASSVLIVIVGIIFGSMAQSIHSAMQWIVSGLWGGFAVPNILKWHWWRFNGYGYFWGMIIGVVSAMLVPILFPGMDPLQAFPYIMAASGIACVIASLMTGADDIEVLKLFYRQVRPWGFWKPVYKLVKEEDPSFILDSSAARDLMNVGIGIVWQMTWVLAPIYLIIKEYQHMWITVFVLIVTSFLLKKTWYNRLTID